MYTAVFFQEKSPFAEKLLDGGKTESFVCLAPQAELFGGIAPLFSGFPCFPPEMSKSCRVRGGHALLKGGADLCWS